MTTLMIEMPDDRKDDGPAMSCLADRERAFVVALISAGGGPAQVQNAAKAAGYSDSSYGWQLMRKDKILAAMHEEARKKLLSGALLGSKVLIEIAMDGGHKDRFKAAKELLAHSGLAPKSEQTINVNHANVDTKTVIEEITMFAKQLGLDPVALLGSAGVIVDADFTVIEPEKVDYSKEEW